MIIIMADEHARQALGAYGNAVVQTPNLDRLAGQGTVFENAYCNYPLCVPSRASFATGRYVHETGNWDNATPYTGAVPGWGHLLQAGGRRVVSIGKLHYRNAEDATGIDEQIIPLHVLGGEGDPTVLIRDLPNKTVAKLAKTAGPGDSDYLRYDRQIRDATLAWLRKAAAAPAGEPWCLFVSFACPHFPLIAPPDYFARYDLDSISLPFGRDVDPEADHPIIRSFKRNFGYDAHFEDDRHIRVALAAYYGMVTFQDDNVGEILSLLDETGLAAGTTVLYTADHGDNLGTRRMWGKQNMYEEAAGIPLLLRGPSVRAGGRVATPVSLVDVGPTVLDVVGLGDRQPAEMPGRSLIDIAAEPYDPDRTVFCEYHGRGALGGVFMVRWDHWKFIHYVGFPPQLFDLRSDPRELHDLGTAPGYEAIRKEGMARLRRICDPEAVNARVFADQERRIRELGGEEKIREMTGIVYSPPPQAT
jgi:choline-sulfatase